MHITGMFFSVGEARERMLFSNVQGVLQEGQRPSADDPCNHCDQSQRKENEGRSIIRRTSVMCSKQKSFPQQSVLHGVTATSKLDPNR